MDGSVSDEVASELSEEGVLLGRDVLDEAGNLGLHLGVLRRMGLVQVRRAGRWMYYRPADTLDDATVAALTALLGPRGTATAACE